MSEETRSNTSGSDGWLNAHLDSVRARIEHEASLIAKADDRETVEPRDVAQAALRFVPGDRVPAAERVPALTSWGITGVTLVSAILAVAFGLLGLYQTRTGNSDGALDIAKIFAGAIVGSTGANVAAAASRRRSG